MSRAKENNYSVQIWKYTIARNKFLCVISRIKIRVDNAFFKTKQVYKRMDKRLIKYAVWEWIVYESSHPWIYEVWWVMWCKYEVTCKLLNKKNVGMYLLTCIYIF